MCGLDENSFEVFDSGLSQIVCLCASGESFDERNDPGSSRFLIRRL